ncbi:hypothetical protein ABID59_001423 [Bradyrhizobium sp. S3.3.6]|uniref:helix-turn-helix domain-containing protein n=1 Tax=Bradyrhizobium sp. S3.3.6 TaxID=3156429 RepID=UPI0033944F5C
MDSNIVQFHSAARRPAAPAAPIGEASVIEFPSPECRVLSPPRAQCSKTAHGRKSAFGDDEWYRAFGRQLFEARIKARVSIEDAAAAAGRTVETWRHYEITGRGRLTFPVLRFARRYGLRLDDIFDGANAALRDIAETDLSK